jgi:hypothetical protein
MTIYINLPRDGKAMVSLGQWCTNSGFCTSMLVYGNQQKLALFFSGATMGLTVKLVDYNFKPEHHAGFMGHSGDKRWDLMDQQSEHHRTSLDAWNWDNLRPVGNTC